MRFVLKLFSVIVMSYLVLVPDAIAKSFFTSLPDVPLMQGLSEVEEQSLSFDKPEGRILMATAIMNDSITDSQVELFYSQALPQFGWEQKSAFSYVRSGETLTISIHDEALNDAAQKFLEITISP